MTKMAYIDPRTQEECRRCNGTGHMPPWPGSKGLVICGVCRAIEIDAVTEIKEFLSVCDGDCDHPYCWSQKVVAQPPSVENRDNLSEEPVELPDCDETDEEIAVGKAAYPGSNAYIPYISGQTYAAMEYSKYLSRTRQLQASLQRERRLREELAEERLGNIVSACECSAEDACAFVKRAEAAESRVAVLEGLLGEYRESRHHVIHRGPTSLPTQGCDLCARTDAALTPPVSPLTETK